ncbi:hypothetical protein PR003_g11488 [Phytophthora rubi]|uniref:Uncharacterized protein n=1 Tax=Phytophthora rubi TaxID=129364 RepID=A0A6A3M721_9STRA|nr:hypothetical protein PR002_g10976 [Phytophthora rubi]KAE9031215.1 hypothetical protein PR001_g11068 [Phytophthora rubi]KAE9338466.1 hypothetical protein PR003_g11488 [Phytophthora rubi]
MGRWAPVALAGGSGVAAFAVGGSSSRFARDRRSRCGAKWWTSRRVVFTAFVQFLDRPF